MIKIRLFDLSQSVISKKFSQMSMTPQKMKPKTKKTVIAKVAMKNITKQN